MSEQDHTYELPLGKVDAFRCLCRRTWLRTRDPERCMTSDGHILHVSSDNYFHCCTRAFRWVEPPDKEQQEGEANAAGAD